MPLPLCVRIEADDHRSAEALLADGWRQIETLQTWRSTVATTGLRHPDMIRPTKAEHRQLIIAAGRWFSQDRLHADPKVDKEVADEAKRQWMKDALADIYREIWILGTMPVEGFVIVRPGTPVIIDLIAVDPLLRGRGIARRLLQHVVGTYGKGIQAGTQATNAAACRLYKSMGMTRVR